MNKVLSLAAVMFIGICMFALVCIKNNSQSDADILSTADRLLVEGAVREQMKKYPQSRLQDIYKNFFHDYFGPEHLISDAAAADKYLKSELASYEVCFGSDAEKTGWRGNFYRVNLRVIKERRISYERFFEAFLESARNIKQPSLSLWTAEWNEILLIIEGMPLNLADYEADKKKIRDLLASGSYVMHHSDIYRKHYTPHYRVMSKAAYQSLEIMSGY